MPIYDELDIKLVRDQVADWEWVLAQYWINFQLGVNAVETKDDRCGLCPRYARRTVGRQGREWVALLTCRRCPIVRATGGTCAHMRAAHGFGTDWFYYEHHAYYGVRRVIKTLRRVVAHMVSCNNAGRDECYGRY